MQKELLSKKDIATLTGRHYKTIEVWIRQGFFPRGHYLLGRQVWTRQEFDAWFSALPRELQSKNSVRPGLHNGAA